MEIQEQKTDKADGTTGAGTAQVASVPLFATGGHHDASVRMEAALPLPQGMCRDLTQIQLRSRRGENVSTDLRVRSRWPDGSTQWVAATWFAATSEGPFRADIAPLVQDSQTNTLRDPNHEIVGEHVDRLTFSDEGGRSTLRCHDIAITLEAKVADAGDLSLSEVTSDCVFRGKHFEEYVIRGEIADLPGESPVEWIAQVLVFPSIAVQQWRVTLRNPRCASHPGGIWELGDRNSAVFRSIKLHINRAYETSKDTDKGQQFAHARISADHSWSGPHTRWHLDQLGSGGNEWSHPIHRDRSGNVSVPRRGYLVSDDEGDREGDRATPALVVQHGESRAWGIYVPHFWQTFPRGLRVEPGAITLAAYPEESGHEMELQPGEQTTIGFVLASGTVSDVKERLTESANSPLIRVDPKWVSDSGVIPWLTPRPEATDLYLSLVNLAVEGTDTFFDKRERSDEYGWRHFGEIYGDHEAVFSEDKLVSHYNNQYDVVLGLAINYLRGGDPRWLELSSDLARHVIDIDIYHTDKDIPCYNHGMFWHTTHYVDAGLATHRSYPRGTCGGGPSSGHAYSRGLFLHYCLTGDRTAREAVVKMGDWMIAAEDGKATKYRWFASGETGLTSASGTESYHGPGRGPGNAIEVLVTAYELTHDRRYLDQAERLIRRVIHPNQKIEELDLLDGENKWFYLMFLQALGRYLELKISMNEIDAMYAYARSSLLRYGDWMADHERLFLDEPEKLEYPTETWAAQDLRKVEALQWAARHAQGDRRKRYLERASEFYRRALEQLNEFETKSLCRPVALLLTNGYTHEFFRTGLLETIPAPPQTPDVALPPQQAFLSQKTRAIRNVKILAITAAVVMAVLAATAMIAAFS